MATINFTDKVALNDNPNVQDINKVKDSDMNLIKQVVNQIIKTLGLYTDNWISSGTYSIGDIVINDNRYFKNITGTNTTTEPKNDTTNWEETTIILNEQSSSLINTYCCDYINDCNTYSTNEINTGKTWIDGKPIYRKIVVIDELPDNTAAAYSSGITDSVDKMLNITGTAMSKNTFTNAFPLPYIDKYSGSNNNIELVWLGTSKEVRITTDTNRTTLCAYIFLEYTKAN